MKIQELQTLARKIKMTVRIEGGFLCVGNTYGDFQFPKNADGSHAAKTMLEKLIAQTEGMIKRSTDYGN